MKENNKIRGIFEGFTSGFLFKIVYLALVLISFNTFALDVPYLKNAFVALSVALGGIVLVYRLIHFKRFNQNEIHMDSCRLSGQLSAFAASESAVMAFWSRFRRGCG